jgi:fructokinase
MVDVKKRQAQGTMVRGVEKADRAATSLPGQNKPRNINCMKKNFPLIFGEVLFDCFPDGRQTLGGAPFNVAWNLQAFGMSPLFISRVGEDDLGRRILEKMQAWDMNLSSLQVDSSFPTGRVSIELRGGEPRFTILPDRAYDHISAPAVTVQASPPFLYHGSLAVRNNVSRETLSLLKSDYRCPIFVDVNLREPWWEHDTVLSFLEDAAWLKLNEDEMHTLFPEGEDMEQTCSMLLDRFPMDAVFVTRGSRGASAWTRDGRSASIAPLENVAVVDTVGAGDAFSSVLLLGLTKKWPLSTTLERAQDFASAVVGQRGAVTEDMAFYEPFISRWSLQ